MISIQKLDDATFAAYRRLRLQALKALPTAFTSSWAEEVDKSDDAWRQRLRDSHIRMLLAMAGARAVGMSGCQFDQREKKKHKATLIAVYVDPVYRGKGVGKRLIDAALHMAFSDENIEAVNLTVTGDNESAIRAYEHQGFRRWGEEAAALKVNNSYYSKIHMELWRAQWQRSD